MRPLNLVAALALVLAAGRVHAEPFLPGNNIDDFGPFTYSNPASNSAASKPAGRVSPIPSNNVDDFGPLVAERTATEQEVGAAGGEPGMEVKAAERAEERAAVEAYNRERFLRQCWMSGP